ncbi:hypothetical protein [Streptomyces sp. NPDC005805]|uniref:hypothetical protein n=1 Tax=Streptomyces sp. NPDC005805 TaxID=3157068 RepID=UPI0033E73762
MSKRQRRPALPEAGRDTFYTQPRRRTANVAAVTVAGLAAIVLVTTGSITTPRDEATDQEDVTARWYRAFLRDLPGHRPTGERVITSGKSDPGLPVVVRLPATPDGQARRVVYRCHATSATVTATATAHTEAGTRHRFPAAPCGPTIASVSVEPYQSVTLSSDDDNAVLLWAVVTTRR